MIGGGRAVAPWRAIGHNPHDQWLTPKYITDALGLFDLDPCAAEPRKWDIGTVANYTDSGLGRQWMGRVFMNPPYSDVAKWIERLANHGTGTALVFARTETQWFVNQVWSRATAVLFLAGRVKFIRGDEQDGPGHDATSASVLIAYGLNDAIRLRESGLAGQFIYHGGHG